MWSWSGVASHQFGSKVAGSDGWRRFAAAVHLGMARLRRHPVAAINVLVVGFAYQLVLVLAALMAAKAVGMSVAVGPTALLAFFPAVLIAQVLPISISGLGVREGAFVLFLTPLGVPTQQAIALGLLLYLLNVAVSLLGAPCLRRRRSWAAHRRCVSDVAAQAEAVPKRRPIYREVIYIAAVYLVYSTVRNHFGSAGGAPGHANGIAYGHALDVIDLERNLRLFFEQRLQSWYLGLPEHGFIQFWNVFYGTAHFVVTRARWRGCSSAIPRATRAGATRSRSRTLLALLGFAAFSLMPPRLLDKPVEEYGPPPVDGHRTLRLRGHASGVSDLLVVRLRRSQDAVEPVRGDAEPAHGMGGLGACSCCCRSFAEDGCAG